jgi:hypothetical protein
MYGSMCGKAAERKCSTEEQLLVDEGAALAAASQAPDVTGPITHGVQCCAVLSGAIAAM